MRMQTALMIVAFTNNILHSADARAMVFALEFQLRFEYQYNFAYSFWLIKSPQKRASAQW